MIRSAVGNARASLAGIHRVRFLLLRFPGFRGWIEPRWGAWEATSRRDRRELGAGWASMGASGVSTQAAAGPERAGCEGRWRRWASGGERHAAQPVQRQQELACPRPAGGQVQVELAGRAGQPPGQAQVACSQRLGGDQLLAQADPAGPAGEVVRDDVEGQPGRVGSEPAGGQVVEADAVLEVTDGVLDLGVAAVVGLQRQRVPVAVGDEAVVVVVAEQRELGAWVGRTRRTTSRMTRPLRPNGR